MTRARPLPLALATLMSAGCSAEPTCLEDFQGRQVSSASYDGSAVLSAAGDSSRQVFQATITGLPRLWEPGSAIVSSALRTAVTQHYVEGPPGSDGRTEMPRVVVTFSDELAPTFPPAGPPFIPTAAPLSFAANLFPICGEGVTGGCCAYGATECTVTHTLFVTRLDGAPFPPVEATWVTSSNAQISSCPVPDGTPEATLDPVELP